METCSEDRCYATTSRYGVPAEGPDTPTGKTRWGRIRSARAARLITSWESHTDTEIPQLNLRGCAGRCCVTASYRVLERSLAARLRTYSCAFPWGLVSPVPSSALLAW